MLAKGLDRRNRLGIRIAYTFAHQGKELNHAARLTNKLIETIESDKPNLTKQFFVDKAIHEAAFIMERIDKRWPWQVKRPRLTPLVPEAWYFAYDCKK